MNLFSKGLKETQMSPKILNALLLIATICTILMFVVVRAGYKQNQHSAEVIGESATSGIIAAQQLKVDLAKMDASFARQIDSNSAASNANLQFAEARKSLSASLVEACEHIHFGSAETVPIKRIEYVLPVYQSAVTDALKSKSQGDQTSAMTNAIEAHRLMTEVLLPAADQLDEANSTALNNAYIEQAGANHHVNIEVLMAGFVLVVFLSGIQLYFYIMTNRRINRGLALATVLTLCFTIYASHQFLSADSYISQAKESDFQRLHVMWRTEARMQQAHADMLFKQLSSDNQLFSRDLRISESKILSLPPAITADAFAKQADAQNGVSEEPTGYLATLARDRGSVDDHQAISQAIYHYGQFSSAVKSNDASAEQSFDAMQSDLTAAKQANTTSFKEHANGAFSALSDMETLAVLLSILVALSSFAGVRERLRDFEV